MTSRAHIRLVPSAKPDNSALSDDNVAAARAGDRVAQQQVFNGLYPLVRKHLYFQLGTKQQELLEEVVQESMMQIFTSLHSFRGESKLSTWALKIAIRKGRRHAQKLAKNPVVTSGDWENAGFSQVLSTTAAEVRVLLLSVNAKKREAFILMEFLGMTAQEAGVALGVSPNTAASRSRHALQELRKMGKEKLPC